jgi:hypothetical protein
MPQTSLWENILVWDQQGTELLHYSVTWFCLCKRNCTVHAETGDKRKIIKDVCICSPWEKEWSRSYTRRKASSVDFNRHTCWAMRAMAVCWIQSASPYNCKESGRWSWCLICPTAKHRENSLETLPVFIMHVRKPVYKDNSNNTCKEQLYYK